VVRVDAGETRVLRRARGLCPEPVDIGEGADEIVAFGAHLKNTFAVVRGGRAFVGPHIGDLDDPQSLRHQGEALETYLRLFRARPRVAACDLHPDYASTRLGERWADEHPGASPVVRVQHHHAHVASVMAEHGLRGEVIGVAFDGTGFGPDGTVWGGEFLVADERRFERAGHLAAVRLPGGDLCAREGWRMVAAYLAAAGMPASAPPEWLGRPGGAFDERRWRLVTRLCGSDLAPLTSSAGRLFDAVASLVGLAHTSSFEAEAAIRLEALARRVPAAAVDPYPVDLEGSWPVVLDAPRLVARMAADRERGRAADEIAAAFHESLARSIVAVCERVRSATGLSRVALGGGVFQNAILLGRTSSLLAGAGFTPYTNVRLPANDGSISLGQALVAASLAGAETGR
ncbi:MAG TPA: carbamoyltransferase HypF, partial [Candidatus Dormibacteraeota bacterium]|nr:carbamoyltransferase HypF [Candidatus Dormibacteraeota bacterium]